MRQHVTEDERGQFQQRWHVQPEVYLHFKNNLIDFDGNISDVGTRKFLQEFVDQFIDWIEKLSLNRR